MKRIIVFLFTILSTGAFAQNVTVLYGNGGYNNNGFRLTIRQGTDTIADFFRGRIKLFNSVLLVKDSMPTMTIPGANYFLLYDTVSNKLSKVLPSNIGLAPSGGLTGQVLTKSSNSSFDYGWSLLPVVASGVYTPTLTNVTNVASSTPFQCQWLQVGNTVTVSGRVSIDPTTAAAPFRLGISLPVAANFTAGENAGGVGSAAAGVNSYAIFADPTGDRAEMSGQAEVDTAIDIYFTFTYSLPVT